MLSKSTHITTSSIHLEPDSVITMYAKPFICGMCNQYLDATVLHCTNGHIWCIACMNRFEQKGGTTFCHLCGSEYTLNRIKISLIATVEQEGLMTCPREGCDYKFKISDRNVIGKLHYNTRCKKRPILCPWSDVHITCGSGKCKSSSDRRRMSISLSDREKGMCIGDNLAKEVSCSATFRGDFAYSDICKHLLSSHSEYDVNRSKISGCETVGVNIHNKNNTYRVVDTSNGLGGFVTTFHPNAHTSKYSKSVILCRDDRARGGLMLTLLKNGRWLSVDATEIPDNMENRVAVSSICKVNITNPHSKRVDGEGSFGDVHNTTSKLRNKSLKSWVLNYTLESSPTNRITVVRNIIVKEWPIDTQVTRMKMKRDDPNVILTLNIQVDMTRNYNDHQAQVIVDPLTHPLTYMMKCVDNHRKFSVEVHSICRYMNKSRRSSINKKAISNACKKSKSKTNLGSNLRSGPGNRS